MTKFITVTADGGTSGSVWIGWVGYIHTVAGGVPKHISSLTCDAGQMFSDQWHKSVQSHIVSILIWNIEFWYKITSWATQATSDFNLKCLRQETLLLPWK